MLRKILVFVLCLVIGLAFAAPATASVITSRPASDWTEAADPELPGATNPTALAFMNPNTGFGVAINYGSRFIKLEKDDPSLPDPVIEVSVTERALDNGSAVVTVIETGNNVPALAFHFADWMYVVTHPNFPFEANPYYPIIGEQGVVIDAIGLMEGEPPVTCTTDLLVDYISMIKFKIPYPGADLPFARNLLGIDSVDLSEDLISWHVIASGKGTLSAKAADWGFTPGKTAEVTINQLALYGTGGISAPGGDLWPAETVNINEIGN